MTSTLSRLGRLRSSAIGIFALLASVSAGAVAPVSDAQREGLPTLYEAALTTSEGNFTELRSLLFRAFAPSALADRFGGELHYTLFGPNNSAVISFLDGLDAAEADALLDVDNGLLRELVLHHFAVGDWYADYFPVGALVMANGDLATVYWNGEEAKIQDAVISGEAILKNGVFHGIDSVLIPPGFLEKLEAAAR